ncbi:MAG: 1,4-alpha-glucan branching protein GlgB [Lachnospiraceae bacterium]|nr:1,4-alpha-glucan branching protein GlgB [Lachnospiraceae bacterium]
MNDMLQNWINWIQYDELMNCTNNAPHFLLGAHDCGEGQVITAYRPDAYRIELVSKNGKYQEDMEGIGDRGFFGIYFPKKKYTKYKLKVYYGDGTIIETEDPYNFPSQISSMDCHLFAEGKHYEIYEKLGAHPMTIDGVEGVHFAVWAPHARRVSVVGDFNLWDARMHQMNILGSSGIYEIFIPGVQVGAIYKFQILTRDGEILHKADPYATSTQMRPENASMVADIRDFKWSDSAWIKKRQGKDRLACRKDPISIYEVHLGSWKKRDDEINEGYYNYREIAPELADYVLEMGYTHIELMGIAEHPFDGSWGYQVTGYYAPTKRYGNPDDFMYFVDYMHSKGIAVILDWVPAHFPRDAHGLAKFDGLPLYEHPDTRRGEHPHWGTLIFNYEMNEVANFLVANALYWIEKFHVDGLRVDAVASMLYLDYGKDNGNWLPNKNGGRENTDVIALFQHLNTILEERDPGALMIAEESTAWAGVTAPASMQGLGFLFKWDMGWMNDFLQYMKCPPESRHYDHYKLTFSMMYAYTENFIQALSHDEVVHGKATLLNKMPGKREEQFANLRVAYGFMYGHPGKKLLFMGQEFAQDHEWDESVSISWGDLEYEEHRGIQRYVKALNKLYKDYPAMYVHDGNNMGFEWMSCDDRMSSVVSFVRRGETTRKQLLFICNFHSKEYRDFRVGVPCAGFYQEVLNSDAEEFGGMNRVNNFKPIKAEAIPCDGKDYSIGFALPPLTTVVFAYDFKQEKKKKIVVKKKY